MSVNWKVSDFPYEVAVIRWRVCVEIFIDCDSSHKGLKRTRSYFDAVTENKRYTLYLHRVATSLENTESLENSGNLKN